MKMWPVGVVLGCLIVTIFASALTAATWGMDSGIIVSWLGTASALGVGAIWIFQHRTD